MKNEWTKRIEELEAENTRLRMYRDAAESRAQGLEVERDAAVKWLEEYKSKTYCAYCGAIFNIDSDASHVSEHIRTCPHHPMRELEAENAALKEYRTAEARRRAELYAAKVDANWCLKNEIEAVRKELAEARLEIDKRDHWIKARDTLLAEARREVERIKKVLELGCQDSESVCPYWINMKDFEKENEHLEEENQRLRETLDRIESMATIENTEIQKIAREALKEASHEG